VRFGIEDKEDRSAKAMHGDLLRFLCIDEESQRYARRIWDIIEPKLDEAIDIFYAAIRNSPVGGLIPDDVLERLRPKQSEHWARLFTSNFDVVYANSVRRAGIRHRDIGLDAMWFIAAYMSLKAELTNLIVHADIPTTEKGRLVRTLDKYVAVDMGLAVSTYLAAVVD
jgi:hypothetical protein